MSRTKVLILVLCAMTASAVFGQSSTDLAQELRIVWGGSKSRPYLGSISISTGTIKVVRNLCVQENCLGAVADESPNTVSITQNVSSNFGGCDIAVRGSSSAILTLRFRDGLAGEFVERAVTLGELQQNNWMNAIDDAGSRVSIDRQAYDRLRVAGPVEAGAVQLCNTIWNATVSGYHTGLPEGDYSLTAALTTGRNQFFETSVHVDAEGNFADLTIPIPIPSVEGPVRLDLAIHRSGFISSITSWKPLLTRSVDLVAFDPAAKHKQITKWTPLHAIDTVAAVKPEGLSWLTSFTGNLASRALEAPEAIGIPTLDLTEQLVHLIPYARNISVSGTVAQSGSVSVRNVSGISAMERCISIPALAWIELPLSGLRVGEPHRLRIQIPTDLPSSLNVSIKDTAYGQHQHLTPQSSVEITNQDCQLTQGVVTHELVFWPRSESIAIQLASASRTRSAAVGKVLVEQAQVEQLSNDTRGVQEERQAALYFDQPLLAECFAAPLEPDAATGRYYETWLTWQSVAERLVMQMQLAGANTLVLSVQSGGNSLLPLASVAQQPRLDKSAFFVDGRAPHSHDAVELLLRHMERAGFKLIIEADFSDANQLSKLNRQTNAELFQSELSDTARASTPEAGRVQRLNPLHKDVQQALTEPILELAKRYQSFSSFKGISLRLDERSQALFAGDRWGYNESIVKQFASANNLVIPGAADQRAKLFASPARYRYLTWRAEQLTKSFEQMGRLVHAVSPAVDLSLNLVRLMDANPTEFSFVEPTTLLRNSPQLMLGYGIDVAALSQSKELQVILGAVRHNQRLGNSSESLRQLQSSQDWITGQSSQPPAALVTHLPRALHLSRAANSVAPTDADWIYPDAQRPGVQARRQLQELAWNSDLQTLGYGGWHPIWVGNDWVTNWIATYKQLPPVELRDLKLYPEDVPLKIRQGGYEENQYLVIINHGPWQTKATLQTNFVPEEIELIGVSETQKLEKVDEGLAITLDAFDMAALKVRDVRRLEVNSAVYALPEDHVDELVVQLDRLEWLLSRSADPGQQEVLLGGAGAFEQWQDANKPSGWNLSALPQTTIQKTREFPHSGEFSVMIENRNPEPATAWIQSTPFKLPATGRLTVRAWMRSAAADPQPPKVRLGLTGRLSNGERYQNSLVFGRGAGEDAKKISDDWGRRPIEMHVSDVPVDDLNEVQVAIDVVGPGKVWIDDVEVVQSWLHPDERNFLRGQLLVARQKLLSNNPFSAAKLLESPLVELLSAMDSGDLSGSSTEAAATSESANATWNRSRWSVQQWREAMRQRWGR